MPNQVLSKSLPCFSYAVQWEELFSSVHTTGDVLCEHLSKVLQNIYH